ncbi:hypothetical protein AV530_006417 [Patagioenas fasciata monilis]|uniref:Uncharacterized protein n=1 Tax=Patagioenas fasciata monilis TaxID=372326 RepID=A0A1V4KGI4_PATFA|nr:hypothetical protein AV530_006417 [Patagioenas fasciata monilis]
MMKELTGTVGSCIGCWPGELVQLSKWSEAPHGAEEVIGAGGLGKKVLPIIKSLSKAHRLLFNAMKINQGTLTAGNLKRTKKEAVTNNSGDFEAQPQNFILHPGLEN